MWSNNYSAAEQVFQKPMKNASGKMEDNTANEQ